MRNKINVFIICVLFSFAFQANAKVSHPIDVSAFKTDSLLWNLKQLSEAPTFTWLNTESSVRSLAFNGLTYNGKPTRVFAYYSNPALIRGLNAENQHYPGVIL
ncbi:MAG: hypothetical protein WCG93_15650, partial [Paludibacter sp.]